MSNIIDFIAPKVKAQTIDAVSQPTFGPIELSGGSELNGQVTITASDTSVDIGDTFTVAVEINTNDVNINEYRVTIDFDPTKLTVIDADPNTDGTQISFLDNVFTIANPVDDNTVSSVGRIRLVASAPSQPLTVNTQVAEIEFQAQSLGDTSIQVVEGNTGTQLIRQAGIGLSYSTNEVSISVEQETTQDDDQNDTTTSGSTTTGSSTGSTSGTTGTIVETPNTSISPGVLSFISLLFGGALITLGSMLWFNRRPTNRK